MHTQAIQLGLFEDARSPTIEEVHMKWSYSRRGDLERCPRQYYYHYYGSTARRAPTEPLKQQLRELRKLSNRHLRAGNLLHLAIWTYLKSSQVGAGDQGLIDWVVRIFHQDRNFSKANQVFQDTGDQQHAPTCLLEFYYHLDDADALYQEAEERLITALTHFLANDGFEFLRFGGRRPSARVEEMVSVEDDLFTAQGKIDVAFWDDTGLTIADWKIGTSGSADENLQLGFYALWGTREYNCAPEDITVHKVHLVDKTLESFITSDVELRRVRARIIQDLEKMTLLDPYGRSGAVEVFKPCDQPKICALCRYQGLCPKCA
jgi:hypothetical protein